MSFSTHLRHFQLGINSLFGRKRLPKDVHNVLNCTREHFLLSFLPFLRSRLLGTLQIGKIVLKMAMLRC